MTCGGARYSRLIKDTTRTLFHSRTPRSLNVRARRTRCCSEFTVFNHFSTSKVRWASTLPSSPIFKAIASHDQSSPAIIHGASNRTFSYGGLLHDVAAARDKLSALTEGKPLVGERIAFLAENSYDYVVTFLSILSCDAIVVPLAPTHPTSELRYILDNSEAAVLLSTEKFQVKAKEVVNEGLSYTPKLEILSKIEEHVVPSADAVDFDSKTVEHGGLMLYTSGTTNRPKGVVLSTSTMTAQARSLIQAWEYAPSDLLLHVLPLHHIHGTINALFTPLMAGSAIEFAYPFNPDTVWKRFAAPFLRDSSSKDTPPKKPITFFTAVPTVYNRLLSTHLLLSEETQNATRKAISPNNLRLNISGSAALPTPIKQAWTNLSHGNVLLERYGMTEVGMALSCGLPMESRVDGSVGWPLPGVEARLVDPETNTVIQPEEDITDQTEQPRQGEIQLRGPTVFKEYFRNPTATAKEFVVADPDDTNMEKWFKTGDIAIRQPYTPTVTASQDEVRPSWAKGPIYSILGRLSIDILKIGGEKVSALEIERELLSLPEIDEVAVLGLPDQKWGQKVAAVIVLSEVGKRGKSGKQPARGDGNWGIMDLRRAVKSKLAVHKIPTEVRVVETIPRNAMGKINKKTLARDVFGVGP